MVKFYNNNVNDLFELDKPKKKVSINDIYAQTYNISNASAMKMANDYVYGCNEKMVKKDEHIANE